MSSMSMLVPISRVAKVKEALPQLAPILAPKLTTPGIAAPKVPVAAASNVLTPKTNTTGGFYGPPPPPQMLPVAAASGGISPALNPVMELPDIKGGGKGKATPKVNPYDALVMDAQNRLKNLEGNKPGAYTSVYQKQIDALLQGILDNEKFSYDLEADPLYRQYRQQYVDLGNRAMRDTTGNAASLTGGYGNSYAATAGNQSYQNYLGQLNNVIPSLYDSAMNAWQNQQQRRHNQMAELNSLESTNYGRYMDEMKQYQNELDYWYNKYRDDQKMQLAWK